MGDITRKKTGEFLGIVFDFLRVNNEWLNIKNSKNE